MTRLNEYCRPKPMCFGYTVLKLHEFLRQPRLSEFSDDWQALINAHLHQM